MENENFAASKASEPLMSKNSQPAQAPAKVPVVSVMDDDESKKMYLPQVDGDGAHYKKDFGEVEIKQPPKFIGLTQEELQKYADDPFWRKLRMALFILFWISWILMFAIAIVLVVTSPKCPPKPPRHWWQKQLCYQAYTRTFKDSDGDGVGDLKGMKEKLDTISGMHVQTIWPVPVIASHNFSGYDVTNFEAVHDRLGTLDDFKGLVKTAHDNKMFVIIDLPITTMSTESHWFKNSSTRSTGAFANHFRWASQQPASQPADRWVWNDKRKEYYFTYGDQKWPVLNWDSNEVREDIKKVLRTWMDLGVDGFYLGNVQLMALKLDGSPDWNTISQRIGELRKIVDIVKNETGKEIALFTSLSATDQDQAELLVRDGGLSYVLDNSLSQVDQACDAQCIAAKMVKTPSNETWPVFEIGNPYLDRVASRVGSKERAELLQMLLFMLNGGINTYYGDELGLLNVEESKIMLDNPDKFVMRSPMQWNENENADFSSATNLPIPVHPDYKDNNLEKLLKAKTSSAKLFKKMAEWRLNDETFLYGGIEGPIAQGDLIAIKRISYPPSPTYVAILNFSNNTVNVNVKEQFKLSLPPTAGEPTVGMMTTNLAATGTYSNRDPVDLEKLTLTPFAGLVAKVKG